jgi:hypothetical protein
LILDSAAAWQVAAIAGMQAQEKGLIAHYQGTWQLEAYATPPALPPPSAHASGEGRLAKVSFPVKS